MSEASHHFLCPNCRSPVEEKGAGYACGRCNRIYPILFGIPDFRLQGDRYLSLQDEREKARKLSEFGKAHDLKALVAHYYSITDDVPPHLEPVFSDYVLSASGRSVSALGELAPDDGLSLLDLGCGSGGALVSGEALFKYRTGVDNALRWLVIAQKRLEEAGVTATLVCADAEALPFAGETFSHVLASDLLENTRSPAAAVKSSASVLELRGRLYVSSSNLRWIGPHPATGVWAAGLLPTGLRASILRRRHGVDILRAVSFVSPASVRRMARTAGLRQVEAKPFQPEMERFAARSALSRFFAGGYSMLAKAPLFRTVLLHAGPVFQAIFVKERSA
ncbi:MAG: methyltransferase domain-containing protein [Tepidisphaeraceae bacterium]